MRREPVEAARATVAPDTAAQGLTRRHLLTLDVVFGAAAGGGLMLGVTRPASGPGHGTRFARCGRGKRSDASRCR
ncbi:hypothetical protein WQE_35445 [Paraburkholderia hospita]|uniref:Uncharacterized protein n=1 Tax=Paraburkholderia hospita TaxID=169430 RepID=A0ABP2PEE1_9BURK|nr:hypothetical protein WQE_35445 [Paraburkholderia hospita]OUL85455.1 hypothetical protein CA602_18160 [Paraburkholderia hospita]OUL92108.1 hypothetical protein CA601_12365 [Paraburkholderia hospita]